MAGGRRRELHVIPQFPLIGERAGRLQMLPALHRHAAAPGVAVVRHHTALQAVNAGGQAPVLRRLREHAVHERLLLLLRRFRSPHGVQPRQHQPRVINLRERRQHLLHARVLVLLPGALRVRGFFVNPTQHPIVQLHCQIGHHRN